MTRKYAARQPLDVRAELHCSLQEASRLVFLHTLLDRMEMVDDVRQLVSLLTTYIEWKEGL